MPRLFIAQGFVARVPPHWIRAVARVLAHAKTCRCAARGFVARECGVERKRIPVRASTHPTSGNAGARTCEDSRSAPPTDQTESVAEVAERRAETAVRQPATLGVAVPTAATDSTSDRRPHRSFRHRESDRGYFSKVSCRSISSSSSNLTRLQNARAIRRLRAVFFESCAPFLSQFHKVRQRTFVP